MNTKNYEEDILFNTEYIKELLNREKEIRKEINALSKPVLSDHSSINWIFEEFCRYYNVSPSYIRRKKKGNSNKIKYKFIFVVVSLLCPKALAGIKLDNGLGKSIANMLGLKHPGIISHILPDVACWYKYNQQDRKEINEIYNRILMMKTSAGSNPK